MNDLSEHRDPVSDAPSEPYLSAIITFLDRATGTRKAMTYPITRIELFRGMSSANPTGTPTRVFVVDGEQWRELS